MNVQPSTLIGSEVQDSMDRALRDLRISVIDNCNLRCTYCMPLDKYGEGYKFLPGDQLLSFDEIVRLARLFSGMGVRKVRLTGGEPLLRKDLPDLIRSLGEVEGIEDIALTSNGLLLRKHARAMKDAGLSRVTVSLDALDDDVFGRMNGRGVKAEPVLDGIAAAQEVGLGPVKINAVIQKGVNDQEAISLAEYFRGTGCILRFIEYMDVGNRNHWERDQVVPSSELLARIGERYPLKAKEENYAGEVASRYVYEDGQGEIGFISSVTNTFCGGCTRARISASGGFYTCLFASTGVDLRALLRSNMNDEQLLDKLGGIWRQRDDRYSELRAANSDDARHTPKVEMYEIGG